MAKHTERASTLEEVRQQLADGKAWKVTLGAVLRKMGVRRNARIVTTDFGDTAFQIRLQEPNETENVLVEIPYRELAVSRRGNDDQPTFTLSGPIEVTRRDEAGGRKRVTRTLVLLAIARDGDKLARKRRFYVKFNKALRRYVPAYY